MKKLSFTKVKNLVYIAVAAVPLYYIYSYIGCPFRYLFGFSCAGCGMTRALKALLTGDFALAFEMNPMIYLLPVAAVIYFLRKRIPGKILTILIYVGIATAVIIYLIRLFSHNEVVYIAPETGIIYKIIRRSIVNYDTFIFIIIYFFFDN